MSYGLRLLALMCTTVVVRLGAFSTRHSLIQLSNLFDFIRWSHPFQRSRSALRQLISYPHLFFGYIIPQKLIICTIRLRQPEKQPRLKAFG